MDIYCVSDFYGCPDHSIVWEGLEDMEKMFTEVIEVITEWLNLISGPGNYGNKGMALILAESNIQCKSHHVCYQVKFFRVCTQTGAAYNIRSFSGRKHSVLNNVCASEISVSISSYA